MRKLLLLVSSQFISLFLFAQTINVDQLKGLKTRSLGPAGMSGRVTAIDVNLQASDNIFIGTASGGVWHSPNAGISWNPIFDKQPVQSIGSLSINQSNPSEIWVGTGEGNPRNSQNSGEGIYKSIDGGKNWTCMGLKKTKTIHRIIIHRDNPNVVFAGVQGSAWGPNEDRGIFKTTDGGKTWKKVLYINDEVGCADLVVDPSNPNKLIAAMWEYGRKPWTFNSGGPGSGLYISHDGGETWKKKTAKDGLPKGDLGRMGLAIAPSAPNVVYALVEAKENALYKSTDGGFKWKKQSTHENIGNRPFYYYDIFVDPQNENRVYSLWSVISKSEDGGKSWDRFVGWEVHPDHHAFWVHPDDPNYMIEGNDGGLNISHDRGVTWRFVENLPLAQFYHINYDMNIPYNVMGGLQDNGSWVGPSQVWQSGGIRNYHWQEVFFGDGFDVMSRPDDSRYVYAMSQGGNLGYVDTHSGRTKFIKPVHPDNKKLRFNWNAALAQNPFTECGIYYGSQFVHKSMDCGVTWEIISPDLTTNDTTKQKQDKSGGLTIDATNAENNTTIVAIAPSPVDENVIWVGTDDGNLQLTQNGGKNWTNLLSRLPGVKAGSWIPYIDVSKKNAGEAFVVVSDYRRNDWRPMVFHTNDFGKNFRRIVDENQANGHALCIVQDPVEDNLLWLGTDFGLYFSIDFGRNWNKWMNGYPSVTTTDLKIHPREHDLIIGTFGRSVWILDDIRPFREMARTQGQALKNDFAVFDAPDAYLANNKSVAGSRFTAGSYFEGDNKSRNAMITVWRSFSNEESKENTDAKLKKEDKKEPKAKVNVFDSGGELVRSFSTTLDTGMTRIYWNMRHDGVRNPSRRKAKVDADMPSGYQALPGEYKVVVHYKDHKDSTMLRVHPDPRVDFSMKDRIAQQDAYKSYYEVIKTASQGFDQLKEAKATMKRVDASMAHVPDSLKTDLKDLAKAIKKEIKAIEEIYMDPEGLKGIQRNPDRLSRRLSIVSRYIGASYGAPSPSANILLENAKKELSTALQRINQLMESDFKTYREKVEGMDYSMFKKMETLKLEE